MAEQRVHIVGAHLNNKGAELMAWTVIEQLGRRVPGARFSIAKSGPVDAAERMGLEVVHPLRGMKRTVNRLSARIGLRTAYGEHGLHRRQKTVVLDISGFAYGDFWGAKKARDRAGSLIGDGFPVHLLPQAFGPFEDPSLLQEMRSILKNAASVAARDHRSLGYLEAIAPGRAVLMPDMTFSLDVAGRTVTLPTSPYVCLVLNNKLIKSGTIDRETLISLYVDAARVVRDAGAEPIVVPHEPVEDHELSVDFVNATGASRADFADARDAKRFLAGAHCVVTSRFHGLVNGLSSGVPSFAVGWSHKYRELLSDFGTTDALFSGDAAAFTAALKTVLRDPKAHAEHANRIRSALEPKRAALSAYWDQLASDITARGKS